MPADERTILQVAINGPAKGQVFERPLSERDVYLPWANEPEMYANGIVVRRPTTIYNPFHVRLFGRSIWVLSERPPNDTELFEWFANDLAKRVVAAPTVITVVPQKGISHGDQANQRANPREDTR